MKKLDNKGFVLVETLVVAVFLVSIFSILYNNFYPLMGEYERRETFDDIDSKYKIYWIKRMVQDSSYNLDTKSLTKSDPSYKVFLEFSCNNFPSGTKRTTCNETLTRVNSSKIYIIDFVTTDFKAKVKDNDSFSAGIRDYMTFLPEYTVGSLNQAQYRLIVEFHNTKDNNDYYSYSTIEVKKA